MATRTIKGKKMEKNKDKEQGKAKQLEIDDRHVKQLNKSIKGSEAITGINLTNKDHIPACGCAIGDLSAIQQQLKKEK
jgi:hypothetical protein